MIVPRCLESQGCQFDPTFLYNISFVLLPSPVALYVILFCFWPILLTSLSLSLHIPKGKLICVALVFCFLSGLLLLFIEGL